MSATTSTTDSPPLPDGVTTNDRVVLLDGECVLCNRLAHWVAKREPRGRLRMTSLQSAPGQALLRYAGLPVDDHDTMVLIDRGRVFTRSSAALRVAGYLRFPWWIGRALLIVPWFLRDPFYWLVARYRFRWFGKYDSCQLPPPELRGRFLPE